MHPETLSKETAEVLHKIKDSVSGFYLAGGTALALELGHRISIDLDFFSAGQFSIQQLVAVLKDFGHLEISSQDKDTLNGVLDEVKISFFRYPYGLMFPVREYNGVHLADERDIAAMKILAASDRGSKKDFVDIFILLKQYSLDEIIRFFKDKYVGCNYNMLHIMKSLTYFTDADEDVDPIYVNTISWDDVKKKIKEVVDQYTQAHTSTTI
jgi:hypothetical protein